MMVWAIVAIGALSFIVWAHHMYVSGMNPYFGFFFATTTLIIAIPTAIKVYNWVLTLWRGDIQINIPNLFAIGFIFTFVHGGLTGLFLGNVTVDLPLSDTYFVIGHFHMVMGVSPVMVLFGAIYHWFPKMTRQDAERALGPGALLDDVPRHVRDLPADALHRHSRHAAALLRLRHDGLHPGVGARRQRGDHDRRDRRRRRRRSSSSSTCSTACARASRRPTTRGARRRSSGRRRRRRPCTATGDRSCPSSIAGPTTTACPASRRTSSRRTSRRKGHTSLAHS